MADAKPAAAPAPAPAEIKLKTGKWADEDDSAPSTPAPDAKPADALAAKVAETLKIQEPQKAGPDAQVNLSKGGIIDWTMEVQVQQADPNSPLYSVASFEELNLRPELLKGVYELKFNKPTKIQEKALPTILANPPHNLIAQSQSGTGKTAAFTLGMLSRVDETKNYPQALCLAPTRELARQIGDVVSAMSKFTKIRITFAIKDQTVSGQVTDHIIIGTTGSVWDWITRKHFDPKKINVFVCDEADHMIDQQGMGDQTIKIKKQLRPDVQILLFSATWKPEVMNFGRRVVGDKATVLTLKRSELSLEGIKQYYIDCANEEAKFPVLADLYGLVSVGQVVIFCQRKDTVNRLAAEMERAGHTVAKFTGDLDPAARDALMDSFRDNKTRVLIASNVLARGIDVSQVNVVINYDLPLLPNDKVDLETYLHRIGRTGRFGRKGVGINFTHDARSRAQVKEIEAFYGREIKRVPTDDPEQFEQMLKL